MLQIKTAGAVAVTSHHTAAVTAYSNNSMHLFGGKKCYNLTQNKDRWCLIVPLYFDIIIDKYKLNASKCSSHLCCNELLAVWFFKHKIT